MKSMICLLVLIALCSVVYAQFGPCTAEEVGGFRALVDVCKTFPQSPNSLILGVEIIQTFPKGLAGDQAQLTEAFGAVSYMFATLFNISLYVPNGDAVQPTQLYSVCVVYNQLITTPLAPYITIPNLFGLLSIVKYGVQNALSPQPAASNFTAAYFANNAPGAVRLALVPNGMTVSWQTLAPYAQRPAVRFGCTKNDLYRLRKGDSHTYGTVQFHDVVLRNLRPNTKYYYTIVGDKNRVIRSFTTAPSRFNFDQSFVATILGDMGYINAGDTYNALIAQLPKTDMVIHIGDISYADNYFLRPEYAYLDTYEESWNIWQSWMEPITSAVPYMVLPGNHEAACQLFLSYMTCPTNQQNFTAYRNRFRMPSKESHAGDVENMWSSFNYGFAHFVMIDTETDFASSPEGPGANTAAGPFGGANGIPSQLAWLEADLDRANQSRNIRPWIIVMGHRPIYTGIMVDPLTNVLDGFNPAVPAAFQALLAKYKVDIYFAGHLHFYERLYPRANGVSQVFPTNIYKNPTAPTYIVNGAAGNDERHDVYGYDNTIGSYYNNQDYGFGKLRIANRTHLQWQYIRSATKVVDDELWIIQESYGKMRRPVQDHRPYNGDEAVYEDNYDNEDDDDY